MSDEMRQVVKTLANLCPTAIVSGRAREKVYEFVRLPELVYAGSHGMDISDGRFCRVGAADACENGHMNGHGNGRTNGHGNGHTNGNGSGHTNGNGNGHINGNANGNGNGHTEPGSGMRSFCAAEEFEDVMIEIDQLLREAVRHVPGAEVENNKFCVSVHYRNIDQTLTSAAAIQSRVEGALANFDCLRMTQGRKVFEVRPTIDWDKGKAVEYLLQVFGMAHSADVLPIYIGDDKTDEDAFRVLYERGQGCGILVSAIAKQTMASYTLRDPPQVMRFLTLLGEFLLSEQSRASSGAVQAPAAE